MHLPTFKLLILFESVCKTCWFWAFFLWLDPLRYILSQRTMPFFSFYFSFYVLPFKKYFHSFFINISIKKTINKFSFLQEEVPDL